MATALAAFDDRPFFERALRHGVDHRLLDAARVAVIEADLARGVVQIAHYFGTEYLRPELELALRRMVVLMSLYLEHHSDGDPARAAVSLRDNSLLSHSKGGSDLLRQLLAMPESTLLLEAAPTPEQQRAWLDDKTGAHPWSLAQYRAEHARRRYVAERVACALWLTQKLGAARADIDDADAALRSAMLVLFAARSTLQMPGRTAFVQLVDAARRPRAKLNAARFELFLSDAPDAVATCARGAMTEFIERELPRLRAPDASADALLYGATTTPYFLVERFDEDVSAYDKLVAKEWHRVTRGDADDPHVLAGVLLLIATGQPPKATLLLKDAKAIIVAFRSDGFDDAATRRYVEQHAPQASRDDLLRFWDEELEPEARERLADDDPDWPDKSMERALGYLHATCRAGWKKRRA